MFGGSTAFGHGVADGETIAAYLDELDTSTTAYVNFGVPGAHQRLELEKLILLLQKGYRPSRVVFIDGLNDVYAMLRTNFRPEETPAAPYDAYGHEYNIKRVSGPRAVMIGDSSADSRAAQGAGVPFIGVTFGYGESPIEVLNPDAVIHSFTDLVPVLRRVLGGSTAG